MQDLNMIAGEMTEGSNKFRHLRAEAPSGEYRSFWTDMRGVAFQQAWIDVGAYSVRYLRAGDPAAPKLLMIPGTGGHAEAFIGNIGELSAQFDCWAIDMVGHGYSSRPDRPYDTFFATDFLADFYKAAGITRAHLLGCSVGSWHALRLAMRFPDLVDRIIMTAPIGGPTPDAEDPWLAFWTEWPMLHRPNPESDNREIREVLAQAPSWETAKPIIDQLILEPANRVDDLIAARLDVNCQPGAAETARHVVWWQDLDLRARNSLSRDDLRGIPNHVLGCIGEIEAVRPMVEEMFRCLPNGELIIWEGVGHWPQYEDPGQFNRIALEFLTRP